MEKLTDRQEAFAQAVGTTGKTQSDAYRDNYKTAGWTNQAIAEAASRLASTSKIQARIMELQSAKREVASTALSFDVTKLLETYFKIAFVDANELTSMRVGACRHCWGVDHGFQWKEAEYIEAVTKWELAERKRKPADEQPPMPDPSGGFGFMRTRAPNLECPRCEGEGEWRMVIRDTTMLSDGAKLLYQGVQQTKDGYKILFADKNKALDQLGRMLGAFDDRLALDLNAKVRSLHLTTSDPIEAARAYQAMISGH